MKSFSYKFIGKSQINLQKTDLINDSIYYIFQQDIQEKKITSFCINEIYKNSI